jgi:hypothetical protein
MQRGPTDPPSPVTAGIGNGRDRSRAAARLRDDMTTGRRVRGADRGGRSYGTWLVSNALGACETFSAGGRSYSLALRPRREYLPYSLTLQDFRHDIYPGTDIPKNFSSLVRLRNPARGEDREVLIYMNQPLRYDGKAFFQASFGKGDTLSILQVVENPGWILPYVSCVLVAIGLIVHFAITCAAPAMAAGAPEA